MLSSSTRPSTARPSTARGRTQTTRHSIFSPPDYGFGFPPPLGIGFGVGFAIVQPLWRWCAFDWGQRRIQLDIQKFNTLNRRRTGIGHTWQHRLGQPGSALHGDLASYAISTHRLSRGDSASECAELWSAGIDGGLTHNAASFLSRRAIANDRVALATAGVRLRWTSAPGSHQGAIRSRRSSDHRRSHHPWRKFKHRRYRSSASLSRDR
jgi:hypothetical protein